MDKPDEYRLVETIQVNDFDSILNEVTSIREEDDYVVIEFTTKSGNVNTRKYRPGTALKMKARS